MNEYKYKKILSNITFFVSGFAVIILIMQILDIIFVNNDNLIIGKIGFLPDMFLFSIMSALLIVYTLNTYKFKMIKLQLLIGSIFALFLSLLSHFINLDLDYFNLFILLLIIVIYLLYLPLLIKNLLSQISSFVNKRSRLFSNTNWPIKKIERLYLVLWTLIQIIFGSMYLLMVLFILGWNSIFNSANYSAPYDLTILKYVLSIYLIALYTAMTFLIFKKKKVFVYVSLNIIISSLIMIYPIFIYELFQFFKDLGTPSNISMITASNYTMIILLYFIMNMIAVSILTNKEL